VAELAPWRRGLRHPPARLEAQRAAASNSVRYLTNAKYLLLESESVDGTPVATPMWFAAVDETIFVRANPESMQLERIRRRPVVKVAACTMRGVTFSDYIECVARIVPQGAEAQASTALDHSCGALRRLLSALARSDDVYLELTPVAVKATPTPEVAERPLLRLVHDARQYDTIPSGAA
jgi:PPOX class probable F420-dependent enzyme